MPGKGLSCSPSAAWRPGNWGSKYSGPERAFRLLPATAYTTNVLPMNCTEVEHMYVHMACTLRIFSARAYYTCNMHVCTYTYDLDNLASLKAFGAQKPCIHVLILQRRKLKLREVNWLVQVSLCVRDGETIKLLLALPDKEPSKDKIKI